MAIVANEYNAKGKTALIIEAKHTRKRMIEEMREELPTTETLAKQKSRRRWQERQQKRQATQRKQKK